MAALKQHDGRDIRQHQIKVRNTGDGLSQAVTVDPVDLHIGDTVYALIECKKSKDGFEEINGGDDLKMVHVLRGGSATLITRDIARPLVEAQTERIIKARDEATGNQQLPLGKPPAKAKGATKKTGNVTPIGSGRKRPAKKTVAKKS